MPINQQGSSSTPSSSDSFYFKSLLELDAYLHKPRVPSHTGQKYIPRSNVTSGSQGKLLVCHDYKGGYTESPRSLSYTFNFWPSCDTFVYFSHHRVTIPPPEWCTSAHRQGVKILGTLIFEDGGEEDGLRLLVGRTPHSRTQHSNPSPTIPLSSYYARALALLALDHNFDGWLLNFECPLAGGMVQTHLLSAWITMLDRELKLAVGEHAQVVWYDSVVFTGHLQWQDRLNNLNLPFFGASSSIFTNYTWPPHFPTLSAQYLLSVKPEDIGNKHFSDIFCGVDVWGRGSHGRGGFGIFKAIEHINPEELGLSVALFGQAWTWESEQDKFGWSWDDWWDYERRLWVGPEPRVETLLEEGLKKQAASQDPNEPPVPECPHGPFRPLSSFFPHRPPPNPIELPFCTVFCPGVGRSWFVNGVRVMHSETGWTDIDKQTSLGDMVWPKPTPSWEGHNQDGEQFPEVVSEISFNDAWFGGTSLKLKVKGAHTELSETFRCFGIPINSLLLTPHTSYQARLVYKITSSSVSVDLGLSIKPLPQVGLDAEIEMLDLEEAALEPIQDASGWTETEIKFKIPADSTGDVVSSIGIQLGFMTEEGSLGYEFELLIGQIVVFPSPAKGIPPPSPRILFVEYDENSRTLAWETGLTLPPPPPIGTAIIPDDPEPPWVLDRSRFWQPAFSYFNVFMQLPSLDGTYDGMERSTFLGTTSLHSGTQFSCKGIAPSAPVGQKVRFHIQGVTDRGIALEESRCAFVGIQYSDLSG